MIACPTRFAPALLALAVLGCASVPPESVELSRSVSAMIASGKSSHVALVHRHFDAQAAQVDAFMLGEYKTRFLAHVLVLLKKKDPAVTALSPAQYDAAMGRVFRTRDEVQSKVRGQREEVLRAIEEHYAMLQAAQADLTALLRSAAEVTETQSAYLSRLGERVGVTGARIREAEDGLSKGLAMLDSLFGEALKKLPEE